MTELVIVRGLPGSGKSTFASTLKNHWHYESDMYFTNEGKYNFEPQKIGEAHQWCQNLTLCALQSEHDVVVANTFTTYREVEPYILMARKYGARVLIFKCTGAYGSIHLPASEKEAIMKRMASRWEDLIDEVDI
jgi:predicted kinase